MFTPVTTEPIAYALRGDRANDPSTLFYLTPQTAGQTQSYLNRYTSIAQKGSANDPGRGERLIRFDREQLLRILTRVDNAWEAGDTVTDAEGLAKVVDALDYAALQELVTAAQNMAALKESEKNS